MHLYSIKRRIGAIRLLLRCRCRTQRQRPRVRLQPLHFDVTIQWANCSHITHMPLSSSSIVCYSLSITVVLCDWEGKGLAEVAANNYWFTKLTVG